MKLKPLPGDIVRAISGPISGPRASRWGAAAKRFALRGRRFGLWSGRASVRAAKGTYRHRRGIAKVTVVGGATGIVTGLSAIVYFAYTLPVPDLGARQPPSPSMVLEASDGGSFATRGRFTGNWVKVSDLPPDLINAVLAVEDRRFYDHFGIDLRGVVRAAITNITSGGVRQGGSTITQQLAKMTFLSPERKLRRKIQEALLALWLEKNLTKDEILTRYLNVAYFGAGAYGVDGASRRYFNKPARSLTLSEASMLAGLVQAPSYFAPTRDLTTARQRSQRVLRSMIEAGYVDEDRAAEAVADPARLAVNPQTAIGQNYFADWVLDRAKRVLGPVSASLTIETTLDPELQRIAENVVTRWLNREGEERQVGQAAMVVMTPSGEVLAMVGGRDYRESQFNRATQAHRQSGSLFKLFVYLAAFDAGFTPDSTMVDQPVNIENWRPANYYKGYRGKVDLRTAFADSINTVAVQLAEKVGRGEVIGAALSLGVRSPMEPLPSLSLGTAEVTLLEMTGAYAAMAADGRRVNPHAVLAIRGPRRTLYRYSGSAKDEGNAAPPWNQKHMLDLLETAIRSGTGKAAAIDIPAAGKTGTTTDNRDAWFIGFTRDLVVGVWVGNDDNSPMKGVSGGGLPAKMWRDFMIKAYGQKGFAELGGDVG
ncbi:MAG: PBP1A family penicillin-binding protein [Proteobacteria bacterium]|nr:PBP1A family penicillin-binding protein [Pseudomonadota bacterium]